MPLQKRFLVMFPCLYDYFVKVWQVYPPNIVLFLNEGSEEADESIQAAKEKVQSFCDVRNVKIDLKNEFSVQELICSIPKEDGFFSAAFILKKDSPSLYVNMLTLASSHSTRITVLDEDFKPLPPYPSLGLNSSQMEMLGILNDRGKIEKKELTSLLGTSQGYVSVSVGILTRQGLVTRNQVRHGTFYSVTQLGKRTFSIISSYIKR